MVREVSSVVTQINNPDRLAQIVQQLTDARQVKKGVQSLLPKTSDVIQNEFRRHVTNEVENKGHRIDVMASLWYAIPVLYTLVSIYQ